MARQKYRLYVAGVPRHVFGSAAAAEVTDEIVRIKSGQHPDYPVHSDLHVDHYSEEWGEWTGLPPQRADALWAAVRRRLDAAASAAPE